MMIQYGMEVREDKVVKLTNIITRMQKLGAGPATIQLNKFALKTGSGSSYVISKRYNIILQVLEHRFPVLPLFNEPLCCQLHFIKFLSNVNTEKIHREASDVLTIVNQHLHYDDRPIAMLRCQDELIEAGLAGWAKL